MSIHWIKNIPSRVATLLSNRGITGHIVVDTFAHNIVREMSLLEHQGLGKADDILSYLEDDKNLLSPSILLDGNWRKTFDEFLPAKLRCNPALYKLFLSLMETKGKGIGIGELALPLLIEGYRFSNVCDGVLATGEKIEIKNGTGASLKPVKTGDTNKGDIDKHNDTYFNGTRLGCKSLQMHQKHINAVKDPSVYKPWIEAVYPNCDTDRLYEAIKPVWRDNEAVIRELGKFAIREYRMNDGWSAILLINTKKKVMVNISDVENLDVDSLGLKFQPKMARGKDTQAIADGYVNARI